MDGPKKDGTSADVVTGVFKSPVCCSESCCGLCLSSAACELLEIVWPVPVLFSRLSVGCKWFVPLFVVNVVVVAGAVDAVDGVVAVVFELIRLLIDVLLMLLVCTWFWCWWLWCIWCWLWIVCWWLWWWFKLFKWLLWLLLAEWLLLLFMLKVVVVAAVLNKLQVSKLSTLKCAAAADLMRPCRGG